MSDDALVKASDVSPHMQEMLSYEEMAQQHISIKILNQRLVSIIDRMLKWDLDTGIGKQPIIREYQVLMGHQKPPPEEE